MRRSGLLQGDETVKEYRGPFWSKLSAGGGGERDSLTLMMGVIMSGLFSNPKYVDEISHQDPNMLTKNFQKLPKIMLTNFF